MKWLSTTTWMAGVPTEFVLPRSWLCCWGKSFLRTELDSCSDTMCIIYIIITVQCLIFSVLDCCASRYCLDSYCSGKGVRCVCVDSDGCEEHQCWSSRCKLNMAAKNVIDILSYILTWKWLWWWWWWWWWWWGGWCRESYSAPFLLL